MNVFVNDPTFFIIKRTVQQDLMRVKLPIDIHRFVDELVLCVLTNQAKIFRALFQRCTLKTMFFLSKWLPVKKEHFSRCDNFHYFVS
jgi:hypothetical protein